MVSGSAPSHRFGFLLTTAHRRLQQSVGPSAKSSAARLGLLMAIADDAAGTPMLAVGQALEVGPSTLTGLVDRAATEGLVVRVPDPGDGRACLLRLTDIGAEHRRIGIERVHELNARLCDGFTVAELDVVARWLEAIRTRFPKETERWPTPPRTVP